MIKFLVITAKNYPKYKDIMYQFELDLYRHQRTLFNGYYPEFQMTGISDKDATFILFLLNNKPIGYTIYKVYRKFWISELYFISEYREKGLLKQVIKYLINCCKQRHICTLALGVLNTNKHAIISYVKQGFVITEVNLDTSIMELDVNNYLAMQQLQHGGNNENYILSSIR